MGLCLAVQPMSAFVVHARELRAQQVMDSAMVEASPHLCDFDDLGAELLRGLINHGRIVITNPNRRHARRSN